MSFVARAARWLREAGAWRSADRAALARADDAERAGSYPHPYPDGWYVIARSDELGSRPLEVQALGRRLVAFRGADGSPAVLDAYCPHLGANLADGRVREGAIECPFHRWRFAADGRCAHIPYAACTPSSIMARAWHAVDYHGMVCCYHDNAHPARGLPAQPPYALPPLAELCPGEMVPRGTLDAGSVHMHLVEFTENSADFRHFAALHGDMFLPWTRLRVPGVSVLHEASWEIDPEQPHIANFRDKAELAWRGKPIAGAGALGVARFFGPGSIVCFTFGVRELGHIALFHCHTPVAPLVQRVRFSWFASPRIPRLLVLYIVGAWISQWRADVRIWERKVFLRKPMLVAEDGPIHALRRWYTRFYPDLAAAQAAPSSSNKAGNA